MKKIAWIDTLRVAAAVMVIVVHYFMCGDFSRLTPYINHALSYDVAVITISLFLTLSGYLIPASLERAPSLLNFYWRKLIRIVVPFTVAWFVMSAVSILPALFNDTFAERVSIVCFLRGEVNFLSLILGMFPTDMNVAKLFGTNVAWFIGEWFMWVILWLYLVSPLLYKVAKKFPAASLPVSVIVACAVYYAARPLADAGIIHGAESVFVVRVPEFLLGMLMFIHRDKLMKIRLPLVAIVSACFTAYAIYFVATMPPGYALFFPVNPMRYIMILPLMYLLFVVAEIINASRLKIFAWINSFSGVSYAAMIIQHVIIYLFADLIGFGWLNTFGIFAMLLLINVVTFKTAALIKKISDPIEKAIMN